MSGHATSWCVRVCDVCVDVCAYLCVCAYVHAGKGHGFMVGRVVVVAWLHGGQGWLGGCRGIWARVLQHGGPGLGGAACSARRSTYLPGPWPLAPPTLPAAPAS